MIPPPALVMPPAATAPPGPDTPPVALPPAWTAPPAFADPPVFEPPVAPASESLCEPCAVNVPPHAMTTTGRDAAIQAFIRTNLTMTVARRRRVRKKHATRRRTSGAWV